MNLKRHIRRRRLFGAAILLAGLAATSAPAAQPGVADQAAQKDNPVLLKRERLIPSGIGLEQDTKSGKTAREQEASGGLGIFQRMGATLPPLPPEKPFLGDIDEAYGAYQRGYYRMALSLALAKAQKGDASSQTLVAELMSNGFGIKKNEKNAAFWYEQAANAGDPNAQYKYAIMLMEGRVVAQDKALADKMMEKAADGGNKEAQFNIAQVKVAANPGEKGLLEALPWYEKSARQGVPDAQYALSQLYLNLNLPKEKRAQARDWLLKAAKAGYDTAQYDMGVGLINGIGSDKDFNEGFRWMKLAANRGMVLAQNRLAKLYINAIGTRPDPIEAAKWYVLSRRAGLADLELEDFYLGIADEKQQEAIRRANRFATR